MGLRTLFDKSFLQELTLDESVWFDHFFYPIICPLFYVETLADLKKSVREGRTPEDEVRIIAEKFPDSQGTPCVFHLTLALYNLLGINIPMRGQIPVPNGRPIKSHGKSGIVYDSLSENEAFLRWLNMQFLDVEHKYANVWRENLSNLNSKHITKCFQSLGINGKSCKTLQEAKDIADTIVNSTDKLYERMELACMVLRINDLKTQADILKTWGIMNNKPLASYAPYAAFVVTIEIFFQIALAANLISSDRPSNYVDISYLSYLPFCNIIVSSDKLLRKCAPLFLRSNQEFIWGTELKHALKELNEYYLKNITDEINEQGLINFASLPPKEGSFYVSRLWDKYFPSWSEKREFTDLPKSIKNSNLGEEITKMADTPTLSNEQIDFDVHNPDTVTIERRIRKKKGTWYQIPKDIKN